MSWICEGAGEIEPADQPHRSLVAAYPSKPGLQKSSIIFTNLEQFHAHGGLAPNTPLCRPRRYIRRPFPRRALEFFSAASAPRRPLREKDQPKHPPDFAHKHNVRLTGNLSRVESSWPVSPPTRKPAPADPKNTICTPSKHRNRRLSVTGVLEITAGTSFGRPSNSSQGEIAPETTVCRQPPGVMQTEPTPSIAQD